MTMRQLGLEFREENANHVCLVHHSDQRSQSTDSACQAVPEARGIDISISSAGTWHDGASLESFTETPEIELVSEAMYHPRGEGRADLFEYIEVLYNRRRRPSALDYLSPEANELR